MRLESVECGFVEPVAECFFEDDGYVGEVEVGRCGEGGAVGEEEWWDITWVVDWGVLSQCVTYDKVIEKRCGLPTNRSRKVVVFFTAWLAVLRYWYFSVENALGVSSKKMPSTRNFVLLDKIGQFA